MLARPFRSSSSTWLWLWAGLFAVLLHGVSCFSSGPFWLDEADSVLVAQRPWPQMWDALAYDTFPLAHVVLFKAWLALFGFWSPETALRLLGFLIGCGIVATFIAFGRRFAPESVPLFFVFFNFNPAVVRYIDSARPYGLSTLFFLLLAYNALAALETGRRRTIYAAIFAAFGAAHSHYFNALGVIAVAIALWWTARHQEGAGQRAAYKICAGIALALTSALIYLPLLQRASSWLPLTRQPEPDAKMLFFTLNWLLNSMSSGPAYLWIFSVSLALVLLFAWSRSASSLDKTRLTFCLGCATGASLLLLFAMFLGRTNASPWYFIPTLGLTALCLELSWARLPQITALAQPIMRASVLVLGLFLTLDGWASLRQPMATIDRNAQQVARLATPQDIVLVTPWPSGVTFGFYYRGQAPFTTVPPITDYSLVRFDLVGNAFSQPQPIQPLRNQIQKVLQSGNKVFLVGQLEKKPPTSPPPSNPLNAHQMKNSRLKWEAQINAFLNNHSQQKQELLKESVCFSSECPSLTVFQGWRH